MSILLQGRNIEHSYREGKIVTPVLKGVNLDIESSKMTAIVGKSGSGKSTLLHVLGTLDSPDKGQVLFQNKDITALSERQKAKFRNHHLGFIYQFHHLLDDFTVLENVMLPLMISNTEVKLTKSRAHHLLERVGLQDRLNYLPSELSGGERQRVAIARAMVHSPELILADEPTGNLDEGNAATVFNLFRELVQDEKTAVVMVTHDLSLARQCDEIFEMVGGVVLPKQPSSDDSLGRATEEIPLIFPHLHGSYATSAAVSSGVAASGASAGAADLAHDASAHVECTGVGSQVSVVAVAAAASAPVELTDAERSEQIAKLRSQQLDKLRSLEEANNLFDSHHRTSNPSLTEPVQHPAQPSHNGDRTVPLSEVTYAPNSAQFSTVESDGETVIVMQQADSNHALDFDHKK